MATFDPHSILLPPPQLTSDVQRVQYQGEAPPPPLPPSSSPSLSVDDLRCYLLDWADMKFPSLVEAAQRITAAYSTNHENHISSPFQNRLPPQQHLHLEFDFDHFEAISSGWAQQLAFRPSVFTLHLYDGAVIPSVLTTLCKRTLTGSTNPSLTSSLTASFPASQQVGAATTTATGNNSMVEFLTQSCHNVEISIGLVDYPPMFSAALAGQLRALSLASSGPEGSAATGCDSTLSAIYPLADASLTSTNADSPLDLTSAGLRHEGDFPAIKWLLLHGVVWSVKQEGAVPSAGEDNSTGGAASVRAMPWSRSIQVQLLGLGVSSTTGDGAGFPSLDTGGSHLSPATTAASTSCRDLIRVELVHAGVSVPCVGDVIQCCGFLLLNTDHVTMTSDKRGCKPRVGKRPAERDMNGYKLPAARPSVKLSNGTPLSSSMHFVASSLVAVSQLPFASVADGVGPQDHRHHLQEQQQLPEPEGGTTAVGGDCYLHTLNPFVDSETTPEEDDQQFWRAWSMWTHRPRANTAQSTAVGPSGGFDGALSSPQFLLTTLLQNAVSSNTTTTRSALLLRLALVSTLLVPSSEQALRVALLADGSVAARDLAAEVRSLDWGRVEFQSASASPAPSVQSSLSSAATPSTVLPSRRTLPGNMGIEIVAGTASLANGRCLVVPAADQLPKASLEQIAALHTGYSVSLACHRGEVVSCPTACAVISIFSTTLMKTNATTTQQVQSVLRRADAVVQVASSAPLSSVDIVLAAADDEGEEGKGGGSGGGREAAGDSTARERWQLLRTLSRRPAEWLPVPQLSKSATLLLQDFYTLARQQLPSSSISQVDSLARLARSHCLLSASTTQLLSMNVPLAATIVDAVVAVALCDATLSAQFGVSVLGGVDLFELSKCGPTPASPSRQPAGTAPCGQQGEDPAAAAAQQHFSFSQFAAQLSMFLRDSNAASGNASSG